MGEAGVGFCPFCRESFEHETECPEHELALVPWDALGPDPEDPANDPWVIDQTPVPVLSLAYGRGYIIAGALLGLLALFVEVVQGVQGGPGLRGYELAVSLPSLWTPLAVAFLMVYVLRTRRAPREMRSLRLALPLLAFVSPISWGWALWRLRDGAPMYSAGQRLIGHAPSTGVFLMLAGSVCLLVGGLRLGRR